MVQTRVHQQEAPSGLTATPVLRWGSHVGHLFERADELRDVLAPYFKAGLENNERCLWVTGAPFGPREARTAMRAVMADFDERERSGQIEILDGDAFYDPNEPLPTDALLADLEARAVAAVAAGYEGLRTSGNCAWVGHQNWREFRSYEARVQKSVRGRRMICMCSYRPEKLRAAEMIDVIDCHDLVLRSAQDVGNVRTTEVIRQLSNSLAEPPTLEAWLELDQSILDALPVGFYCCDVDGSILRTNQKATELWGRPGRLLDAGIRFCGSFRLENLDGGFIAPDQTPMARAALHGETFDATEAVVQNPDGRRWVARVHVAPLRDAAGRVVGAVNCFQDITREHEMRAALERQQQTFDLAMVASQMGTWRYTLADNICVYDHNAQRLYDLTEARFLHDEEGVKAKFHADDMDVMWSRVAQALDPEGDGKYEVEYRVKQSDGSWRWLSAWGTVEFEGKGADRRPVAISGASRDLSELKQAEELRRLLVNELKHRVKNTLATVQSIAAQTLRGASDLQVARRALDERIISLSRAHDLLTARDWAGADLTEVVLRAMEPFPAEQVEISGPHLEVPSGHALALSLALHELATNAAKYGALSVQAGRIEIRWLFEPGRLRLIWQERGGPRVSPPARRGFGSRLLEEAISRDLAGGATVEYAPEGVRCELTALI
ncbi:MAG TPA: MEDS domain-containing protein [Caulobacteraceae bacterium]|jgi:two-component sensor histidine kinase|nr:MEDS domain-containing protein [Caulobacteraceae bacterium]